MVGLHAEQFDYPLPEELIAQEPAPRRDDSRLMVVPPGAGSVGIRHRRFRELPQWLRPGDCLVINDSRVVPARLAARRAGGAGGAVEILLVERLDGGLIHILRRPRTPLCGIQGRPDFSKKKIELGQALVDI